MFSKILKTKKASWVNDLVLIIAMLALLAAATIAIMFIIRRFV